MAFQNGRNKIKSEKLYDVVIAKYSDVVPAIGRISREIALQHQTANTSFLKVDDLKKGKTGFTINFRGDDEQMEFRHLMSKLKSNIIDTIEDVLKTKPYIKNQV